MADQPLDPGTKPMPETPVHVDRQISLQWLVGVAIGLVVGVAGTAWSGAADWTKIQARVGVLESQAAEIRVDIKQAGSQAAAMQASLAVIQSQLADIRNAVMQPQRQGSTTPPQESRRF